MDWVLPTLPPVLMLVLNFVSPYIVSVFASFEWSASAKKVTAVVVSFVISAAVLLLALWVGWVPYDPSPIGIVTLVAMGLLLQQIAYKNFFQESATTVMKTVGVGKEH